MKNLLFLGTLSFSIAFSLGIVVEKNVTKSAAIGGIATISTLSTSFVLSKKSERELKKLNSHTETLKSLETKILDLRIRESKLLQEINSKTQLRKSIEAEYDLIIGELNSLKEEIKSLNNQREYLQKAISKLEIKEKTLLQLIDKKTQPKITIERKDSSLLAKIKEPPKKIHKIREILPEKNTLYAQNLALISKDFWSIYKYNIESFRSQIPRHNWGYYWNQLAHGLNILSEGNTLLAYFAFYGGSHYYKLSYLLDRLFSNLTQSQIDINIEIIDYGCGQALGTTCFLDYLRQNSLPNLKIDAITLIEPSEIALSRGILHINHLRFDSYNIDIKLINKQLQYLNKNDLSTSNKSIKIHIFSNILDITGFEIKDLAITIRESQSGINYFLCVSPTDIQNRIQHFFDFWDQNGCYTKEIQLSSEDLYKETWRFKLDKFQLDKIHRTQKLFSVNL